MTPSPDFYREGLKGMTPDGLSKEADHTLHQWLDAKIERFPWEFLAEVDISTNKKLWGLVGIDVDGSLGGGNLLIPISYNSQKIEYPGLKWMVEMNQEVISKFGVVGYGLVQMGLCLDTRYGECETSASQPGFFGLEPGILITRTLDDVERRKPERRVPGVLSVQEREARKALSAKGVSMVITRDIPSITSITPLSETMIFSEDPLQFP